MSPAYHRHPGPDSREVHSPAQAAAKCICQDDFTEDGVLRASGQAAVLLALWGMTSSPSPVFAHRASSALSHGHCHTGVPNTYNWLMME